MECEITVSNHRAAVLAAITSITDVAKFEDLVRAVLPSVDHRFRGLTPTGVGAHGKTIRDPVDGIGFVWTDTGRIWLGFQATTEQKNVIGKLRKDYTKLIQTLPAVGSSTPRALVALATNTAVGSEKVKMFVEHGLKDSVHVYVVDATKLADILTERENHGIAHAFLGVRPHLANEESLRQASIHALDGLEASIG